VGQDINCLNQFSYKADSIYATAEVSQKKGFGTTAKNFAGEVGSIAIQ